MREADACYEEVVHLQACLGEPEVRIGQVGRCRYCNKTDPTKFRKTAHAVPEALGNKWIVSVDECDDCNEGFSKYDDAVSTAFKPLRTIGAIAGKNGVPQTGRSTGDIVISHSANSEYRGLSFSIEDAKPSEHFWAKLDSGTITGRIPTPIERFRPRLAYKALCKSAFSILPSELLAQYQNLRLWLLDIDDTTNIDCLPVALAFGSFANAPPLVVMKLLRRRADCVGDVPQSLFVLNVGSLCFYLGLSDDTQTFQPASLLGVNVKWRNVIAPPGCEALTITYSNPMFYNWASTELSLIPISAVKMEFDLQSNCGSISPLLRRELRIGRTAV